MPAIGPKLNGAAPLDALAQATEKATAAAQAAQAAAADLYAGKETPPAPAPPPQAS